MVLENVCLPLGAAFVDLVAVLAVVVTGGAKDGQLQLWHRGARHIGVATRQVVYQHSPSLEAQLAGVALEGEGQVGRRVCWRGDCCGLGDFHCHLKQVTFNLELSTFSGRTETTSNSTVSVEMGGMV